MKILATAFSLTLGAWRLRVSIDLEDAPDDRIVVHGVRARVRENRSRERA